ncbi:virulence associated lipoprotein [Borreliella valaisiana]|uniref:Virulent strain associated lipoprotein n=3 Tax=Borreliella TaxID=64895 RepID=C0R8K8_BORVA|nr:virulence associated lipoprotein [Borreliella valaisiana]ACN52793.1 virulent strain associated lipoprotein [Borreliella valaisiana VS116]
MKYNIIASIFVFLFLNACNPDLSTNQKDVKSYYSKKGVKSNKKRLKSNKKILKPKAEANQNQEAKPTQKVDQNQEEDPDKRIKNTLLDDLRNLIETANADREKSIQKAKEEPVDQYGIAAFKELGWSSPGGEKIADNSERSKRYRKRIYATLNDIDISELKTLSEIIMLSGQTQGLFNTLSTFGETLDDVIVHLYPKKDTLDKLKISDLEKLKNSFKELLSIKAIISETLNKLLLDYQNDENSIKTDNTKLESHVTTLYNQILEKNKETKKLKSDIFSIHNL